MAEYIVKAKVYYANQCGHLYCSRNPTAEIVALEAIQCGSESHREHRHYASPLRKSLKNRGKYAGINIIRSFYNKFCSSPERYTLDGISMELRLMRIQCNGSTIVFQTVSAGSNPTIRLQLNFNKVKRCLLFSFNVLLWQATY